MKQQTVNSKIIKASPQTLFKAFTDPKALEIWFAPEGMNAHVHAFDLRIGGGYEMSLSYQESDEKSKGKTNDKEDRYTSEFIEIVENEKIVQAITFDSPDPKFAGTMIMEVTFEPESNGTKVTFTFKNIPIGIKPEDNEEGTISTLENLAKFVE